MTTFYEKVKAYVEGLKREHYGDDFPPFRLYGKGEEAELEIMVAPAISITVERRTSFQGEPRPVTINVSSTGPMRTALAGAVAIWLGVAIRAASTFDKLATEEEAQP